MAVLDADKQGFLRSNSSLMQVAGRAARNINGKVFLYADTISSAMKFLIDETSRRRKIQERYNAENNIVPKTIFKSEDEILISTVVAQKDTELIQLENDFNSDNLDDIETKDLIKEIKRKMLNYAKDLKFEEASILRDKLYELEGKFNDG